MGQYFSDKVIRVQMFRFVAVGLLNTIVGFSIYYILLRYLDLNYTISLLIAHIVGVIHSYLWNKNWTFGVKHNSITTLIRFLVVYTFMFVINYLLLAVFVEVLDYNKIWAQAISLLLTTMISFIGQRYWSFKTNNVESET